MNLNNNSSVRPAPKGFHTPVPAMDLQGNALSYLDGPSRDTGGELDPILSAFSDDDGFTVTIASVELPLPAARQFLKALQEVVEEVSEAAAEFGSGN